MLMLESDDGIIGKAHDDHVAVRLGLAPSLDPREEMKPKRGKTLPGK